MDIMAVMVAFLAGFGLPVQAALNSQLESRWSHHPVLTATISFGFGFLCLAAYVLLTRVSIPPLNGQTSPWHWVGGALGAFFVTAMVIAVPRIGAATAVSLSIAGQVCLSLFLDHYGFIGLAQRSLSWQKLLGAVLVMAGVFLVRKF